MKMNYSIPRIEILIEDNGKFADMAYFFDSPSVMEDVANLRASWINNNLMSPLEINSFINKINSKEEWYKLLGCRRIAKKHKVGATYVRPIMHAVLSGVVDSEDYATVYREFPIAFPEELSLNEEVTYSSSRVREVDYKTTFDQLDGKSIAYVRKYREWFWLYQTPKWGYGRVAKSINKDLPLKEQIASQTVRTGINAYVSNLHSNSRSV